MPKKKTVAKAPVSELDATSSEKKSTRQQAEEHLIRQHGPYIKKNCGDKWEGMVEDTVRQLDANHTAAQNWA